MKLTWEAKDIECGRIVCKPNPNDGEFTPCGWTAKHTYKIGWLAGGNPTREYNSIKGTRKEREEHAEKTRADYCLVCMTDGMIGNGKTKREMAEFLNEYGLIPMPHDWFVKTVEYLRTINERGNTW